MIGEKAVQLFFLVRGEVLVSRQVEDPKTGVTYTMVVERLGPYSILGDEAYVGFYISVHVSIYLSIYLSIYIYIYMGVGGRLARIIAYLYLYLSISICR